MFKEPMVTIIQAVRSQKPGGGYFLTDEQAIFIVKEQCVKDILERLPQKKILGGQFNKAISMVEAILKQYAKFEV